MLLKLDHFPRVRGENKEISNHQPENQPPKNPSKPMPTSRSSISLITFKHCNHLNQVDRIFRYDGSDRVDPPPVTLKSLGSKQMQQWKKGAPGCLRYPGIIS